MKKSATYRPSALRFPRSCALLLASTLVLSGCAGVGGMFCKSNHDEPAVARMMERSCAGERGASLQLGILFESRQDYKSALKYYRAAASPSQANTGAHVPHASNVTGYVMPFDAEAPRRGNAEAEYRLGLMYLQGRGVKKNEVKARRYFSRASEGGHLGAKLWLAENDPDSIPK